MSSVIDRMSRFVDKGSRSRGRECPSFELNSALSNQRVQGMPGAQCTHSLMRAMGVEKTCARVFTAEAPETSGIPHAMVYGLFRALPGDQLLC